MHFAALAVTEKIQVLVHYKAHRSNHVKHPILDHPVPGACSCMSGLWIHNIMHDVQQTSTLATMTEAL